MAEAKEEVAVAVATTGTVIVDTIVTGGTTGGPIGTDMTTGAAQGHGAVIVMTGGATAAPLVALDLVADLVK